MPIRPQAKTRREATIVEEVVPVGKTKRYDSAPGINIGDGSWSDKKKREEAATANGRYSFIEENPLRERSQLTK